MSVLETFFVEDGIRFSPPEEQEKRRDSLRTQLIRYNSKEHQNGSYVEGNDASNYPNSYLEPTSDGYPGLEGPLDG